MPCVFFWLEGLVGVFFFLVPPRGMLLIKITVAAAVLKNMVSPRGMVYCSI